MNKIVFVSWPPDATNYGGNSSLNLDGSISTQNPSSPFESNKNANDKKLENKEENKND